MRLTIEMKPTDRLEIGFGRVIEGNEAWMFGEYFPYIRPTMAQHGLKTLVSFRVVDTNLEGLEPVQGSLSGWPSAESRQRFLDDPAYTAVQQRRDAALQMSDGHLFAALTETISLDPEGDFALIISATKAPEDAIFLSPLAEDSASNEHEGRSLSLHRWGEACALLLAGSPEQAIVLRVRLNH